MFDLARDPEERYDGAREMALAVVQAYDLVIEPNGEGPREPIWMHELDRAYDKTVAHVQAGASVTAKTAKRVSRQGSGAARTAVAHKAGEPPLARERLPQKPPRQLRSV